MANIPVLGNLTVEAPTSGGHAATKTYADSAGGGVKGPARVSGRFFVPVVSATALTTSTGGASGQQVMIPFVLDRDYTFSNGYFEVMTSGSANSIMDWAIYGSDSDGEPSGTPEWEIYNQSGYLTPGQYYHSLSSLSLSAGLYWLGQRWSGDTAPTLRAAKSNALIPLDISTTFSPLECLWSYYSTVGVAWPDLTGDYSSGNFLNGDMPLMAFMLA